MERITINKIQNFMRNSLGSKHIKVEGRENKIDTADDTNNGEILGVVIEDKEDGETCYHFNMKILDIDIE